MGRFRQIIEVLARSKDHFEHLSWIRKCPNQPAVSASEIFQGEFGIYHKKLLAQSAIPIKQPSREGIRFISSASNSVQVLVYEIAELIVFLPEGFRLSHMFDSVTNIKVLRKKTAKSEAIESFAGITLLEPQRRRTNQDAPMEAPAGAVDSPPQEDIEMPPTRLDLSSASVNPSHDLQQNQQGLSRA